MLLRMAPGSGVAPAQDPLSSGVGSATCPFPRALLEIAADTPAMEPLPLAVHGAGPTGQHRRGEEIDDQAAEGPVFRPFQAAFQDVHQFIGLHRGCSPLLLLWSPGALPAVALPEYPPFLTARTVGRLTPKVLAAALTVPPLSRKSWTACRFSGDSAGGLPPLLPSAAARCTPA